MQTDQPNIHRNHQKPEHGAHIEHAIHVRTGDLAEKSGRAAYLLLNGAAKMDPTRKIFPRISKTPRLDIHVVHINDHWSEHRQHPEIAGDSAATDHTDDGGSVV